VEGRRSEVQETIAGLETERAELEAEASRVEALRLEAEQELEEVRSLLASLSTQIAQAEEHKEGLEEDAQRLERELARIQANSGEKPGVLAWPVNGWLSSPFGYRVHPILGTRRLHSGIDLAASSGSPISAAASGVVIIAAPYGGYGNAVVIDHGGGLATLYAHQSRIVVSKGQAVATGDLIGYVGCTGLCTGPHLHFETRESGVPVDPMKYLRG
jgi:murein DD-endopeptidase MepM/ murein hydrolase activator NlpD